MDRAERIKRGVKVLENLERSLGGTPVTSRTRQTRKGALVSGNCSPSLPEGFGEEDELSRTLRERAEAFEKLTGVEADVCADIQQRQQVGLKKYGVTVADNPLPLKAWLQHAYLETLDKAIYLKRAIREMENAEAREVAGKMKEAKSK